MTVSTLTTAGDPIAETAGPPARHRRQAETRSALLRAAIDLCSTRGIDGPTIDEIAAAAGFTKGAFYANFASKHDLYVAMIDERFASELERLERALAGEGEPTAEASSAAVGFVASVNAAPGGARLFFELVTFAARDERLRVRLADRYGSLQRRIAEIYRHWSRDFPAQPPIPLEQITAMTIAMGNGFLLEQQIDPEVPDERYGTMLAVFFRGLQAMALGWEPGSD